jgi:DHA1 family bicyclomycin/chloramphenicol resistance-like MFS transporter
MQKPPISQQTSFTPFSTFQKKWIVVVILALYPLVGMGIDLITPSLPAISRDLHTSHNFSKNLITFYLLGYLIGNFLIGFLSDTFGRKNLMVGNFLIFTLFSLLPALYSQLSLLLFSRFFQGFAMAAFAVCSRGMLSDILSKEDLIRMATLIATMWGIGPIIGPVIGGYLQFYFNWQMCFYFFALIGFLAVLAMIFIIPETLFNKQPFQYLQLKKNFITILTHRRFLGLSMLMGVAYSSLIVFNTLGPFFIQNTMGYSSIYFGHVALCLGLTFLIGTLFSRHLLKKSSPETISFYTILCFVFIAIISLGFALIERLNIWAVIIPSFFMYLMSSIIYPVSMGKALSFFRETAGSGAAVMNLINLGIVSVTSFIMSFIYAKTAIDITIIYLSLMLIAALIYYSFISEPREAPIEEK